MKTCVTVEKAFTEMNLLGQVRFSKHNQAGVLPWFKTIKGYLAPIYALVTFSCQSVIYNRLMGPFLPSGSFHNRGFYDPATAAFVARNSMPASGHRKYLSHLRYITMNSTVL